MKKPRVLVLRAAGINCDREMATAFSWCGARPERVHVNRLLDRTVSLVDFDALALPGGFSYGDVIAAGRILANQVKKVPGLAAFIADGRPVLGVCNGFQALVKAGILPGEALSTPALLPKSEGGSRWVQTASLTDNDSGRFECRWVRLRTSPVSFFTKGLPETVELPIAHGEGKFVAPEPVLDALEPRVALRYAENPNGSQRDIAGLVSAGGNVFGLMPHPERFLTALHHPSRREVAARELGLQIIRNIVDHVRN